jgi:5-oxoprolinase (ATP-hydrolysing)
MSPLATTIEEEGVYIDNFKLVDKGRFCEDELSQLLTGARYPVRNLVQNVNDLKAQIAANEKGVSELSRMIDLFGRDVVEAYMGHVQDNAEESVRRVLDVLKDGEFRYEHDNGTAVVVRITIDKQARTAHVDFTGTSPQQPNNFNAPAAVTRAAVLYVFRTLVDENIPMNEGCLKPIRITIPEGTIVNAKYPAAVCAGNVETSQWVTDTLYGALGVMAAAQGTMNNFTYGNATYQYYETICGGSGAGPGFDGTAAVHTHMTNSRLTDPEVLEHRYPVLLESHRINRGSGGRGRWKGGDGTIRRTRFLEPMTAAILSNHRRIPPFGMDGGEPGSVGDQWIEHPNGRVEKLKAADKREIEAGDVFVIQTPAGGGFGKAS